MSRLLPPAILAIEPDPSTGRLIERALAMTGYDLCVVQDAAAGRRRLRGMAPDLLMVAEHLPDCDGMELVATLVAACDMPCVPVLFLADSAGFAPRARALGAACVGKPLSGSRLRECVARLAVRSPSHLADRSSRQRLLAPLGAG